MENQVTVDIKEKLMRNATYFSVTVAISIIILKIAAWIATDSLSLLSSLIDSVFDVLASVISLVAVNYALQPADEDHRFGHGKAEDIAAFSQSAFIAGSALFISVEAIQRLIYPTPITDEWVGIAVMIISSVLTGGLLLYQNYVIKRTKSTIIQADALHYKTDLMANLLVIIAFLTVLAWDITIIDSIFAILIAVYILTAAIRVAKKAFDKLMDKEFSDDDREKIINAIFENKNVEGVHDLRTRFSGMKPFIQFHLELEGSMTLNEAHAISDTVEQKILKIYPTAEVLIHQDPYGKETVEINKGRVMSIHKKKK